MSTPHGMTCRRGRQLARARRRRLVVVWLAVALCPILAACDSSTPATPSGSAVVLTASTTDVPFNGTAMVVAQLMTAGGQAPPDGTIVTFVTTLGTVQPAQAPTAQGKATATFIAGSTSGTAVIAASWNEGSVTPDGVARISVGTVAAARVLLSANPSSVPFSGGAATITATVIDASGKPLPTMPITFTTTAGTISPPTAKTNADGAAQTTLTTTQPATVTATTGAQGSASGDLGAGASASTTISVSARPQPAVSVTPSANPTAQTTTTFTISAVPAAGTFIQNVSINFGDGTKVLDLGASSGASVVAQHVYQGAGTFTVTATATDSAGASASALSVIIVAPSQPLAVVLAAAPPVVSGANTIYTFTATVTPPTAVVASYEWKFGDGSELLATTANQAVHIFKNGGGPYTVTVTAFTATGSRTQGFTIISP